MDAEWGQKRSRVQPKKRKGNMFKHVSLNERSKRDTDKKKEDMERSRLEDELSTRMNFKTASLHCC